VKSENFAAFPISSLSRIIRELGDRITDSPAYDSLFEHLLKVTGKRASEVEVGKALLQRALQQRKAGKNYEAIRLLGRAQQSLAKEESRREWITSLAAGATAYEAAGLLWAARASLLAAAGLVFADFSARGNLAGQALSCLQRLIWIELRLSRIPCVLAWLEVASFVAHHLLLEGEDREEYLEERKNQDIILGLLLLKVDFWESKNLDFLPGILENLQLEFSRIAVLYLLGHELRLKKEGLIPAGEDATSVQDFFYQWTTQPAASEVPVKPDLLAGTKIKLAAIILGCEFTVECSNKLDSIYLSETILGAIEAFLATSIAQGIYPHRETFTIRLMHTEFDSDLPEYRFQEKPGFTNLEIRHGEEIDHQSQKQRSRFWEWLIEILAGIISRTFAISNTKTFISRLIVEEIAFNRALNYSDVKIPLQNILSSPKYCLADWASLPRHEDFPLIRRVPWNEGISLNQPSNPYSPADKSVSLEEPLDPEKFRHRDVKVISFINQDLWDRAEWEATAYIDFQEGRPPGLVLSFTNIEPGMAIFNEWRNRIGSIDSEEQLRISIITGVDRKKTI